MLPDYLVKRLQHVLNTAARLVTFTRKIDHITPLLFELHWLPKEYCIIFKILLFTFKVVNGVATLYLNEILTQYAPKHNLRSQHKLLLE